ARILAGDCYVIGTECLIAGDGNVWGSEGLRVADLPRHPLQDGVVGRTARYRQRRENGDHGERQASLESAHVRNLLQHVEERSASIRVERFLARAGLGGGYRDRSPIVLDPSGTSTGEFSSKDGARERGGDVPRYGALDESRAAAGGDALVGQE